VQPVDMRALVSLIAGLAALMFSFALDSWLHITTLPLGALSLWTGVGVLREGKPGMGISVAGVILSTIAICAWILSRL
jgi:hypothetical protein